MASANSRGSAVSWLRVTVALAILLGIFFRFYHLDRKVLWEDEILGLVHTLGHSEAQFVADSPRFTRVADVQRYLQPGDGAPRLADTVRSLASEDPQHPPLYYLAARLWMKLFGSSAAAIRSLPAVFGVLVLPCLFAFALELFGSMEVALLAVALVALSPFYVLYSQEAREYSLWTCVILLDGLLFLRALRSNASAHWVAYALLTALALYIYPLTAFVVLGLGVYLAIRERFRLTRAVAGYALGSLGALLAFAPWLAVMLSSHGLSRGMNGIATRKLTPAAIAGIFARDLRLPFFDLGYFRAGPLNSTVIHVALTAFVLVLVAGALLALVRDRPFEVWGFVVIAFCLSMTPLVPKGQFVIQARYFFPLALGVQLAVAALLAKLLFSPSSSRLARAAGLTLLLALLSGEALSCAMSARADTWWNKDYERTRSVAEIVNRTERPILISDYYAPSVLGLSYYLDPQVAVRLNVKCSQCTAAAAAPAATDLPAFATPFVIALPQTTSDAREQVIDPRPYPPQSGPLSMFLSVGS